MKRSVGVTVIAVLSMIGSVLTLLFGISMFVVLAFVSTPASRDFPVSPAGYKLLLAFAALIYILPAIWGIVTSIGLFRLGNWARLSIIVFSVLLVLMSVFAGLGTLLIPTPASNARTDPSLITTIYWVMGSFWLGILAIGIWWLVFFNREKVKQQFMPAGFGVSSPEIFAVQGSGSLPAAVTQRKPERPLSFTVIAWFVLFGCLFMPVMLFLHAPAILLTGIVKGWSATLLYMVFTGINLYIGIGLLFFRKWARKIAIGYFLFTFVNAAVFYFAPGGRSRTLALMDAQHSMFPWTRLSQTGPGFPNDPVPMIIFGAVSILVFILPQLYFLITRKQAWERAAEVAKTT